MGRAGTLSATWSRGAGLYAVGAIRGSVCQVGVRGGARNIVPALAKGEVCLAHAGSMVAALVPQPSPARLQSITRVLGRCHGDAVAQRPKRLQ